MRGGHVVKNLINIEFVLCYVSNEFTVTSVTKQLKIPNVYFVIFNLAKV